jgi:hypothetical protein
MPADTLSSRAIRAQTATTPWSAVPTTPGHASVQGNLIGSID